MCSFLGTILHCLGHPGASCNPRDRYCRWRERKPSSCPKPWAHFIPAAPSSRKATAFPLHGVLSYVVPPKFKHAIYLAIFCAPGQWWFWYRTAPTCLARIFLDTQWHLKKTPVNGSGRKALCPGRGSFQMGRQCLRLEAAREQEKLGWRGARAPLSEGFASRDRFWGPFLYCKRKQESWQHGLRRYHWFSAYFNKWAECSRVLAEFAELEKSGGSWEKRNFFVCFFFNWIDFLNEVGDHSVWVKYSEPDITPSSRESVVLRCCLAVMDSGSAVCPLPRAWKCGNSK